MVKCSQFRYVERDNYFEIVDDAFVNFKPNISATSLSEIVGLSPYNSSMQAIAKILGFYRPDIKNQPHIITGNALESRLISYVNANYPDIKILPADSLFEPRGNVEHHEWKSHFEHPIYSGHIDGLTTEGYIVEVKTTANPQDWIDKIPVQYHIQASLYAKMFGTDKIIFVVGITDKDVYSNPYTHVLNDKNVFIRQVGLYPDIDKIMKDAESIYNNYIVKGRLPISTDEKDLELYNYLHAQILPPKEIANELEKIYPKYLEYKAIEKYYSHLQNQMILSMKYHDVENIVNDGVAYKLLSQSKKVIDDDLMKQKGVYETFLKENTYDKLYIKELEVK